MEKKVPMRTCIACRVSKPKRELIRVVKDGDAVRLDMTGKMNGRGAYVCNDKECITKLCKQKLLNKVFSCAVDQTTYDRIKEEFFGKEN